MSRGLPEAVRQYLNNIDATVEGLDDEAKAALVRQATVVLSTYQGLPLVSLARLIMEPVVQLDGAIVRGNREGGDLETEVRRVMLNGAILASVLTRQARGRPKL